MSALYDKGREGFLDGSIDWDTDTIKCVATDSGYVPNLATDQFLSDVPGGARIATSGALTGKTVVAGVADADDVTLALVPAGHTINRVVFYKDTGVAGTSRLIGQLDTIAGPAALSIPTTGLDVVLRWDGGANRIFKL